MKKLKIPDHETIKNHKYLRWVKRYLENPNLWHCTRQSISRGMFSGLFWTLMPMPFQMVAAVITCLLLRANIILAIVLCWISNPITMGPMMYGTYRLGLWLLGKSADNFPKTLSFTHILDSISAIWQPLLLGSVVAGLVLGIFGYLISFVLWTKIADHLEQKNDD